ncbi:GNAT family N-acetyltransferase [Cognatilysobacter tabacisoli]|uniref:GNAT family N-acetyltransferase n=1 Tax=Cognatilysobacter tabacisoli TaxID=2315424 RepID=UPI000E6AE75E|nr:GNAT family N-acetyltransferase [Lysobacter tabacisoli]
MATEPPGIDDRQAAAAPTGIRVRPATLADVEAISALTTALAERHIVGDCSAEGSARLIAAMQPGPTRERLASGHRTWVAEVEAGPGPAALVGVACVRLPAHLYHLFVADHVQRRGVARALLEAVVAGIADQPDGALTLNASRVGVPAYARMGFIPTGAECTAFGIPSTPMQLLRR